MSRPGVPDWLGGVLTYTLRGFRGVGPYDLPERRALLLEGSPEEADALCRSYLKAMEDAGGRICDVMFVPNGPPGDGPGGVSVLGSLERKILGCRSDGGGADLELTFGPLADVQEGVRHD